MANVIVTFIDIKIEPLNNYSIPHNENTSQNLIDRSQNIEVHLRTNHHNEVKEQLITNPCLEFINIFYLEADSVTFAYKPKHSSDTNNAYLRNHVPKNK